MGPSRCWRVFQPAAKGQHQLKQCGGRELGARTVDLSVPPAPYAQALQDNPEHPPLVATHLVTCGTVGNQIKSFPAASTLSPPLPISHHPKRRGIELRVYT